MRRSLGAVVALALGVGCGEPVPERFPGANVVLVGIDTLRADHLGCYGYPRPTSPRIDALARESVVFETAISQSPWTLPAFASIFTGVVPSSHRAGEGKQVSLRRSAAPAFARLDESRDTMATLLAAAGWRTASFVSNGFLGADFGLTRGFGEVLQSQASKAAVDGALGWLREHGAERFFLFLHVIDPHLPYTPSPEDAAPFVDARYEGSVGLWYPAKFPHPLETAEDRRRVVDLYDGEVRFVDGLVGRLLDALRDLGVRERTLIVLVSDHGEGLFDHGLLGHGQTLYDELLHVPLIVRFPGRALRGRVGRQVRTMDVLPTVLDALALPVPQGLDGVSLLGLARGEAGAPAMDVAFAEYLNEGAEKKAIREQDRKLIFTPATGASLLFDLRSDPGEERTIAAEHPEIVRGLRARLETYLCRSVEGFELSVAGGRETHRVRAKLRTPSRFVEVALVREEAGDTYRRGAGGRLLDVRLSLPAAPGSFEEDGVRFRTAGDAPVELRLSVDGGPLAGERLSLGPGRPRSSSSAPVAANDARLLASCPGRLDPAADGSLHARLAFLRRPEAPPASIDEKTRENLRALGYLN